MTASTIPLRAALYLRVSTARQAEHDVSIPDQKRQGEDLLEALATTPATSLAGVAGKLDAVREGETCEECGEFPWPQIRSAFGDLMRIGRQMTPERFFPASGAASHVGGRPAAASGHERRGP